MNQAKNPIIIFSQSEPGFNSYTKNWKITKTRFEKIKADKPVPLTNVTPKGKQQGESDTRRARKGTHKYNTRSRVNHGTTFKNTPQMFKKYMTETSTTHIGSDYIAHTYPKKYTITVEPVAHHINCETTGRILGYRDLDKMDAPVWTHYMRNELGLMPQDWKAHEGTDTIKFIFHK